MEYDCGTDDIFANSSSETVKEVASSGNENLECNVDGMQIGEECTVGNINPRRMDDSLIATHVIEGFCKPSRKVYCPFCPMSYTSDQNLKCHLKECHGPHLNLIFNEESYPISFQACMLCHATFYTRGLLPLHLLKVHENALVGLLNCKNVKNDGFLHCMYCRYTVVRSNAKALMSHLEKIHFPDFERFVLANCTFKVSAKEAMSSFHETQKFIHYSNSLNRPRRRALLSSSASNSSARRKLDFNAIEEKHVRKVRFKAVKKEKTNKENSISVINLKKKPSRWHFFKKFHIKSQTNKIITSTPNCSNLSYDESEIDFKQFRCASCHLTFKDNENLLNHMGVRNKIKLLL
ncbi:uncharacterized protein LOC124164542 isoform X2 [Ischnura elegans]|uniref:uncharacterized protein LOC124164542 isoform X2 n=1 Tax=Ischnura elegans TaxID=197161 RepID=UPI001ED876E2|nr:uncharacterized protein LOC124164542 isoform X2 [Ischnura elegans]